MFSNSQQLKETKAALIAALGERDKYLRQRDIAVSERNAAVRERDDAIVGKLDRLPAARAAQAPDRHPSIVSDALCALDRLDVARRRFEL